MNTNNENPGVGKAFQVAVTQWMNGNLHATFEMEKKLPIGSPAKLHGFDIADEDNRVVAECKCYTWTETGNIPSAKIRSLNEAAFYLSFLPMATEKMIVMLYSVHERRNESLAEYYFRTNRHLLGSIKVFEFDPKTAVMRLVGQNT